MLLELYYYCSYFFISWIRFYILVGLGWTVVAGKRLELVLDTYLLVVGQDAQFILPPFVEILRSEHGLASLAFGGSALGTLRCTNQTPR